MSDPDHDQYWANNVVANDKLITKPIQSISAATWAAAKAKYKPKTAKELKTGVNAMGVPGRDEET